MKYVPILNFVLLTLFLCVLQLSSMVSEQQLTKSGLVFSLMIWGDGQVNCRTLCVLNLYIPKNKIQ